MWQQSPFSLSKVLKILLLSHIAIFAIDILGQGVFLSFFELNTYRVLHNGEVWRLISYIFSHSLQSPFHILFNMLMLWMFGSQVLQDLGSKKFLWFYFSAGFFAGVISFFFDLAVSRYTNYIGASGSILALLVFYACMYPNREVFFWGLFPIKIKWLVAIIVAMDILFFGKSQVANITHLGGALFGFLYFFLYHRKEHSLHWWQQWNQRQKSKRHFQNKQKSQRIMEDVDRILEKISKQGMSSLSASEKKVLNRASKIKKEQKEKIIPFPEKNQDSSNFPE